MGVDFLTVPADATVEEALRRIRLAENVQPEALLTVHAVDAANRLVRDGQRHRAAPGRPRVPLWSTSSTPTRSGSPPPPTWST